MISYVLPFDYYKISAGISTSTFPQKYAKHPMCIPDWQHSASIMLVINYSFTLNGKEMLCSMLFHSM
jgi:hypothetical protein